MKFFVFLRNLLFGVKPPAATPLSLLVPEVQTLPAPSVSEPAPEASAPVKKSRDPALAKQATRIPSAPSIPTKKTAPAPAALPTTSFTVRTQTPLQPDYLDEQEQALRLLTIAISRQATKFATQSVTTTVKFTAAQLNEGIKSKIVGKEGRNARHFEEKSGVDLLLNDQPDAVVVSSFDPFRREVARAALEILVRDGRIQPAKIEEALAHAKIQVDAQTRDYATRAAKELGLSNIHPAILRVLGTLQFRTSFTQNQLEHSVETAWLCSTLASEMGYDAELAKRAGLLHDLGKALDQKHDGGHSESGAEFAKKYGESELVVRAIAAHHEEILPETWLDHLVIAADALSGARPGARNGSTQNLMERSASMEKIAREIPGVTESYAVQAGRELRVFVDCDQVSDQKARELAGEIAERIQADVKFPGQIKVTVLRELRVTAMAQR
ncbi:MAG: HDIG domain-containing protein [Methylotenera sp.]|nr:HDIG domain-containing protein [Oligoflexia bacterium]